MIFLFLLALVVFGPKKLPEIGRQVGKLLNELRRASNEFKAQIQTEMDNMEQQENAQKMLAPAEPPPGAVANLSLKPGAVSESKEGDSGEVIDLKPIDPKSTDPEPIVIHPLERAVNEESDPNFKELNPADRNPADRNPAELSPAGLDSRDLSPRDLSLDHQALTNDSEAANNHDPDAVIKATNG